MNRLPLRVLDDMRESGRRQASARAELVSGGRSSGGTVVGVLLGFEGLTVDAGDEVSTVEVRRAHVDIAGEEMWLSANPGGYIIGGTVTVQVDGTRRPLHVLGPRSAAPVAGVEVPDAGETVTHLPTLIDPATRELANDALTRLANTFVTSTDEPTPADGEGRPTPAYWTQTNAEGERVARWRWDGSAWVPEPLGAAMVVTEAVIDSLLTNEIFTSQLTLSSEIDGWVNVINGYGQQVFNPEGEAVTQLGAFEQTGLVLTKDGNAAVTARDDGTLTAGAASFDTLSVDGTDIKQMLADQYDPAPRGMLADRYFSSTRGPYSTESGVGWVRWMAVPGRRYEITVTGQVRDPAAGAGVTLRVRGTHTGNPGAGYPAPSLSSSSIDNASNVLGGSSPSHWIGFERTWTWEPDPHGTVEKPTTMLLTMTPATGSSTVEWGGGRVRVKDAGISPTTNSGWFDNGGSDPTPPAPTPSKTLRTRDFGALWLKSWQGDGSSPSSIAGRAMQGRTAYYPAAGEYRSMIGFEDMSPVLGGVPASDIEWIAVRLRNRYSYPTTFVLRAHSAGSAPGSFSFESANGSVSKRLAAGETSWIYLPSSMYAGLRTGVLRGVALFANDSGSGYYGWTTMSGLLMRAKYWN